MRREKINRNTINVFLSAIEVSQQAAAPNPSTHHASILLPRCPGDEIHFVFCIQKELSIFTFFFCLFVALH
jgi:hypothetical protein